MKRNRGIFLLILVIVGVSVVVWTLFLKGRATSTPFVPAPTASPTIKIDEVIVIEVSPTPTVDETSLIKQTVFRKTGLDETNAEVTININTGRHAKGNIKEKEAVGGAYWLAAKTETGWVCVYDGQANPTCSQIAPYNFPKDMVLECLGAGGEVVRR